MFKNLNAYISLLICVIISFTQSFSQPFNPPEWSYDKSIYEVNIRQYSVEGTFKAFEKHLPRLKELGADIFWLMPIHPIGEKNRKGNLGSYYSVKNYKEVNPEFGNIDEFKTLVNEIHKMGMYIIIDWVANHTAWDHIWMKDHPEFYTRDSAGNIVPPVQDWSDVADLNYDNKELWEEMISALRFWVEECDIDGYRCDVAGMVPTEFWIEARTELEKTKNVFMLAEWETPEIHQVFDMTYDWTLHRIMNGIVKKEKTVEDLIFHLKKNKEDYPVNAFRMQFTSNHDENSWNGTEFERLGNGAESFAVLTCLIPGMPLIYTGQEAGNNKRLLFFEKDTVVWKEHKFSDLYSKLFQFKKDNKALHNGIKGGELTILSSSDQKNIFSFSRSSDEDKIIAIFNLSDSINEFEIDSEVLQGSYKNFFTGMPETFSSKESFKLNPWENRVYIK